MQIQTQEPRFFNRLKVMDGERTVMALNLGGAAKDLFLIRPCVHPLYTPAGLPVTEMGAHNFPHHKGVWIGHAQVNGVSFFHDLAEAGWIVPVRVSSDADAERARIDLDLEWRDRRGHGSRNRDPHACGAARGASARAGHGLHLARLARRAGTRRGQPCLGRATA